MTELRRAAQQLMNSLQSGNLDEAEAHLAELQRQIPLCAREEDRRAAAEIVLEARKLARVHRAQTIQTLQLLVRESLYDTEGADTRGTFQLNG